MMDNPFTWLLLASALVFLGSAGHLVSNVPTVVELFGKRRRDAAPGEVVVDRHSVGRGASHGAVKASLALHVLALIGMVVSVLAMAGMIFADHPGTRAVPEESNPLPTATPGG